MRKLQVNAHLEAKEAHVADKSIAERDREDGGVSGMLWKLLNRA